MMIRLALLLGLASLLAGCDSAAPPPTAAGLSTRPCTFPAFEATIRQGPAAGTVFTGTLTVQTDATGRLSGTLAPKEGAAIPVSGQVSGQAINLYLDAGNGTALTGVGTLEHDLATCSGGGGGPFVGPDPGDLGDWSVKPGGPGLAP